MRYSHEIMREIIEMLNITDPAGYSVYNSEELKALLNEFVATFAFEAEMEGAGVGIFYIAEAITKEIV